MNTPIAIGLMITFGIIIVVGMDNIKSFLLKKEQIRADAMVRAEEVKAKNQLELEKLIHKDANKNNCLELSTDDRKVRENRTSLKI